MAWTFVGGLAVSALGACNRVQSSFAPFGAEAESTRTLTVAMTVAAVIIFIGVLLLIRAAHRAPEGRMDTRSGMRLILWLGGIGPAVLLLGLLVLTLPSMEPLSSQAGDLRVRVTGEQFWWRMRYEPAGQPPVLSANELRLPVGETVVLDLDGGDVVHSFWVPGLAGKMDMLPGRTNHLVVRATRPGRYRGQCAEFCGLSHALMAFEVVAMPPPAFRRWLAAERAPAAPVAAPGRAAFVRRGCGGCHRIGGHGADGVIGPDLTHFAAREMFAAGTLPRQTPLVARFIRNPSALKPGARMPAFADMPPGEARAIAAYLQELR